MRCRSPGSPLASSVSATMATSRILAPLPANQRCDGIHSASASSNVIFPVYPVPGEHAASCRSSSWWLLSVTEAAWPVRPLSPRVVSPGLREDKPVKTVAGEGQQVAEVTDRREGDPAHALDRGHALEPAQVELDRLREPGQ